MKNREKYRNVRLRISFLEKEEESGGFIDGALLPEKIAFHGVDDLILKIDRIYDLLNYQLMDERMSLNKKGLSRWKGTCLEGSWEATTEGYRSLLPDNESDRIIYIDTLYRKNTSWQGFFYESKNGQQIKKSFRSVLEFMYLLEA